MRTHRAIQIGTYDPVDGPLSDVIVQRDNRAVVYVTSNEMRSSGYISNGNGMVISYDDRSPKIAVSPSGRVAVAVRDYQDGGRIKISIDGKPAYTLTQQNRLHHIDWLAEGVLAWEARIDKAHGGTDELRIFVNGVDRTGHLNYEMFFGGAFMVWSCGYVGYVDEDGLVVRAHAAESLQQFRTKNDDLFLTPSYPLVERLLIEGTEQVQLKVGDVIGPAFDNLDAGVTWDRSGTHYAYMGMVMDAATLDGIKKLHEIEEQEDAGHPFLTDEEQQAMQSGDEKSPHYQSALKKVTEISEIVHGQHASQRYTVIKDNVAWPGSFSHLDDLAFKGDLLTAITNEGETVRLVVEGELGPPWVAIHHVHREPDGTLSYVAFNGSAFYRVTVAP